MCNNCSSFQGCNFFLANIWNCQHNVFIFDNTNKEMKAKKTAILHMRLTPEDKMKLEEMAKQQQKSISSLITTIINNEHNKGTAIAASHGPTKRNEGSKAKNRVRKTKRAKQVIER